MNKKIIGYVDNDPHWHYCDLCAKRANHDYILTCDPVWDDDVKDVWLVCSECEAFWNPSKKEWK